MAFPLPFGVIFSIQYQLAKIQINKLFFKFHAVSKSASRSNFPNLHSYETLGPIDVQIESNKTMKASNLENIDFKGWISWTYHFEISKRESDFILKFIGVVKKTIIINGLRRPYK
jgi:hypothetical protein